MRWPRSSTRRKYVDGGVFACAYGGCVVRKRVLRPPICDPARRARRAEREAQGGSAPGGNATTGNEAIGDGSRARRVRNGRSEH